MKTVRLTDNQWNTVYTALRLAREGLRVGDDETRKLIEDAMNAVHDYEEETK